MPTGCWVGAVRIGQEVIGGTSAAGRVPLEIRATRVNGGGHNREIEAGRELLKPIKIAAEVMIALGEIGGDRGAQLNLAAGLNDEAAAARQGDRMVKQLLDVIGGDGMLVVAHGCDQPLKLRADPVGWAVLEADASDMAMHGLEVTESTCRHPAHPRFLRSRIRSRRGRTDASILPQFSPV